MMSRKDRLNALCQLLPAQFDTLVYLLKAPQQYFSAPQVPQATRAIEVLRWVEASGKTDALDSELDQLQKSSKRDTPKKASSKKARSKKPKPPQPLEPQVLFHDEMRIKAGSMEKRKFHVPLRPGLRPLHVWVCAEGKENADNGFSLYVVTSLDAMSMDLPVAELRDKVVPRMSAKVSGTFKKDVYLEYQPTGWCLVVRNENWIKSMVVQARVVADPDI